jgi:putative ABC transport system substrate-binding protein
MRRREFIVLLGGVAAAWPGVARGQQAERMLRVGVLSGAAAGDPGNRIRFAAFQQKLQQLGWIDGRNLRIDHRWAAANAETYRKSAARYSLKLSRKSSEMF